MVSDGVVMAVHFQAAVGGSQRLGSHTNLAPLATRVDMAELLSRVYRGREANEIRILSTGIRATERELCTIDLQLLFDDGVMNPGDCGCAAAWYTHIF